MEIWPSYTQKVNVIEKYGMYGMSKSELRGIIGKYILSRKPERVLMVKAARRVLSQKQWLGWG